MNKLGYKNLGNNIYPCTLNLLTAISLNQFSLKVKFHWPSVNKNVNEWFWPRSLPWVKCCGQSSRRDDWRTCCLFRVMLHVRRRIYSGLYHAREMYKPRSKLLVAGSFQSVKKIITWPILIQSFKIISCFETEMHMKKMPYKIWWKRFWGVLWTVKC